MNFQNIILANSINLSDEFEIMDEAATAVESDLKLQDISSYKFSPALEACDEEMEYMCLENVKAYAVTEGFKESISKYWERFKAFCIKIKNLIVRTIQRVIAYLKTLFTRIAAKIVAKFRGKDAKKMAKQVIEGKRYVGKVEVYEKLLDAANMEDLVSLAELSDEKITKATDKAKSMIKAIKETHETTAKIDDIREELEDDFDRKMLSKSELIEKILGDEPGDVDVTKYKDKVEKFVTDLRKAKIPKQIENTKKKILKFIDTVEKEATKSKSISSKRMSLLTFVMNKIVQMANSSLAAIQQLCVMWLQARIKVVNKFYNATEDKEENEDEE